MNKDKSKQSAVPAERQETVRQEIITILLEQPLSAKDISGTVSASEKEVYVHLSHIQKTISKKGYNFVITPAKCRKCGFSFKKREKLRRPGKCPRCRSELISPPLFSIR